MYMYIFSCVFITDVVTSDQPPVPEEDTVFVEVHGNDAFTPITPPSTTALLTPQSQNYPREPLVVSKGRKLCDIYAY